MRFLLNILTLFSLLLFASCEQPAPQERLADENSACPDLGLLLSRTAKVDSLLEASAVWPAIAKVMDQVLKDLEANQQQEEGKCNYLNQRQYPQQPRFIFVDALSTRSARDTVPGGIYYLLRLRGIFSEDAAISEYFSEELGRMALNNPACYQAYLQENPDQEVMLLYSTKWNYLDADLLIGKFQAVPGAEAVVRYLRDWKIRQNEGGS